MSSSEFTEWEAVDQVYGLPDPFTHEVSEKEKTLQAKLAEEARIEEAKHDTRTTKEKWAKFRGAW